MAESDSLGHKTVLPIEIFENIIGFHFNDFPTLAACGLSLSVLLPACRRTRFHTITLHSERRNASPVCTIFEEILRVSPIISQHVYRVRILDPGDFNVDGSDPGSILNIPSQLSNVTNIICSETVAYGWGIFWHRCLWLLDGISSLSALQTVTIESNRFQTELYTSPWSQKIHKLDIFKPFMKPVEGVRQLQPHPRLHLCTLSLNCLEQVEGFSSGDVEQRLHLSKLRHISLSLIVGGLHASSFGAWLSTLAADCPISLQTVVLDINRNTGGVFNGELSGMTDKFLSHWSTWLYNLPSGCPLYPMLDVNFFIPRLPGRGDLSVLRRLAPEHGEEVDFHFVYRSLGKIRARFSALE